MFNLKHFITTRKPAVSQLKSHFARQVTSSNKHSSPVFPVFRDCGNPVVDVSEIPCRSPRIPSRSPRFPWLSLIFPVSQPGGNRAKGIMSGTRKTRVIISDRWRGQATRDGKLGQSVVEWWYLVKTWVGMLLCCDVMRVLKTRVCARLGSRLETPFRTSQSTSSLVAGSCA